MPQPWTFRHASQEYRAFLADVLDRTGLTSDNMAYTLVDGVFQTFRRRLTAQQGLAFASVLPSVPRAIFVAGWQPTDVPELWAERATLIAEAKGLRPNHNLTPDTCIEATSWALQRAVSPPDWTRAMDALPDPARAFWHIEIADRSELEPGFR